MAYVNLNFVPGEILTAAKMNLLAANDASFHDGTGIGDGSIQPQHFDWQDFVRSKQDGTDQPAGATFIQYGRARLNAASGIEAAGLVTFPRQFKAGTIPAVISTFNGYTLPGESWTDTLSSSWAAIAVAAVDVSNVSFAPRIRRLDGATLGGAYYFSWMAIGAA